MIKLSESITKVTVKENDLSFDCTRKEFETLYKRFCIAALTVTVNRAIAWLEI